MQRTNVCWAAKIARRRLKLELQVGQSLQACLLAAEPPRGEDVHSWLARVACLVYAVYRSTNTSRHQQLMWSEAAAHAALQESLYEAAKGHAYSMKVLSGASLYGARR